MSNGAIPSPASFTAPELLAKIRERGGRVFRTQAEGVFVLTSDEELYAWLLRLGGRKFSGGSYLRATNGPTEYDCYVHPIPVIGNESIWQAAAQ